MKIGFIGQGYVGKNYADNYESRGYEVVRYSKEEQFINNKELIKQCEIVFVAVPTPTTKDGFDDSIVRNALSCITAGSTAVVKSTIALGATEKLAQDFPELYLMFSPEFLSERSARKDVDNPHASIIGIPMQTQEYKNRAMMVMKTLPEAPLEKICTSIEAELIKYSRNVHGFYEILFYNMFYDLANSLGADYEVIKEYIKYDPLHVYRYASPIHDSGHTLGKFGRGAGGHCFLKDFKAFKNIAEKSLNDEKYNVLLNALEDKNLDLLINSDKDVEFAKETYGDEVTEKYKNTHK
jgi:UDP-glucose 6-dehydrogenase